VKRLIALTALAGAAASAAAPPPASHEHAIAIAGMHFGPAPAGLRVGDTILWVNRDIVAHSATARDRSFDVVIQPRQSVRVTLRRTGAIAFYCRFHPTMQGVLAVAGR
jgi:plastocyanin